MSNEYILSMNNITKEFSGVRVLHEVNLQVRKGIVMGLMGENGAGKSTLMKILQGVYVATEGEIIFDGNKMKANNIHQALLAGISMIHQEMSPIPDMTVAENIFIGREPRETTNQYMSYIKSVAVLKKAAANTNFELGALDKDIANAIAMAADEIIDGKLEGQFPINVLQGGGGTSSNMNVNEVIANRANEMLTGKKGYDKVHPNDHVNMGQSTNDVIPAAISLCAWEQLEGLYNELLRFCEALGKKSEEFKEVVKLGRTCLQDALPLTLGQEFSGYHDMMKRRAAYIKPIQAECNILPIGATAVGTGLGSYGGYKQLIGVKVGEVLGREISVESNYFDGLQNGDIYLDIMHSIKTIAIGASKIATDLRMLSSGPRAGLNEIILPAVQPGSSIMPGKINPVIPELINQVCYQICGNELTVSMAAEGGELDLNVWEPVIVKNICDSAEMLTNGLKQFRERCIDGIIANKEICRTYAERSLALSGIISAMFDYKTGSAVSQKAFAEDKTVREVAIEMGLLTESQADTMLDPLVLTDNDKQSKLLTSFKERK